ncbi:MAG: hypothetical protein K0S07_401 [Chlamydiales bacterium]|jgi:hypothetical protein|nr:hypothetical protein [Chlamydiales bacterium]
MSQTAIPMQRLVLYLTALILLAPFFLFLQMKQESDALKSVEMEVENAFEQLMLKETKQALNKLVQKHFQNADHFYMEKQIETVVPLEPEIEQLNEIVNYSGFTGDEAIRKRLDHLTLGSNALVFTEGSVQTYATFQETLETLAHPVEMDSQDIAKVLARIEGVPIGPYAAAEGRPQLLITDFKIERKKALETNENFVLNLKVLKREFL